MVHKKSKSRGILEYMKNRPTDGITNMDAFNEFGVTRLGSIIFSLRNQGYPIETIDMECIDRTGRHIKYAKYILKEDEDV